MCKVSLINEIPQGGPDDYKGLRVFYLQTSSPLASNIYIFKNFKKTENQKIEGKETGLVGNTSETVDLKENIDFR